MTTLQPKSISQFQSFGNALQSSNAKKGVLNLKESDRKINDLRGLKLKRKPLIKAMEMEEPRTTAYVNGKVDKNVQSLMDSGLESNNGFPCSGNNQHVISTVGQSTNIVWHDCSIGKQDREKLLQQKGCVIWITGLSGSVERLNLETSKQFRDRGEVGYELGHMFSENVYDAINKCLLGKSTVACALARGLHYRGKLTYILDGDNVRHGLNRDLTFKAEDRAENIRRIGEVAKLFADAGIICIASLISPYRRERDACRALLPDGNFIEVFMDAPLQLCEARDSKGLYKLARAGKIKGFTGIDDPYEPPLNCEIAIQAKVGDCSSPADMAKQVISYLEEEGYLQ